MSAPEFPTTGLIDPRQEAFNSIHALLSLAEASRNDMANSPEARQVAAQLCDTLNDQLDALDSTVVSEGSIALQASAGDMQTGMADLQKLQAKIKSMAEGFERAGDIIAGIDKALGAIRSLGF